MDSDRVHLTMRRLHRPFLPLFFSVAGWTLLQAWVYLLGANFRAHTIVAALGCILTLWSAFPFPGTERIVPQQNDRLRRESRWAVVLGALLLLCVGAVLGKLMAVGSIFLISMTALVLNFIPWAKLPLGQRHPVLPCAAALLGFAAAVSADYRSIDRMFLPLTTWAFWVCACVGLILRAENARRAAREKAAQEAALKADRLLAADGTS